ncbi:fluoride efflux transporter FluC [Brochothrix campestris]|uniref:Fluoride-specific ion channel FluC n=1 Tax=Brochothrix campestris FSL F6-1037 TaxID=1265861 RepID=W7CKZ9_9LIST|nr:CrcB family protein [Brochothrix campestris]EUJ40169.1 camphor resistance protein CrcB [Brochothrix campestris FSL F6-1037]
MNYLMVFVFGGLGGISRYSLSLMLQGNVFPFSTLIVNLLGCFLLVIVNEYLSLKWKLPKAIIVGIGTGFIGAFTTFSAFSMEFMQLYKAGEVALALTYIGASLIGSMIVINLAYWLVHHALNKKGGNV